MFKIFKRVKELQEIARVQEKQIQELQEFAESQQKMLQCIYEENKQEYL